VITVSQWAEARRLFLSEGMSKSAIAETLGISRNTVAKLVAAPQPPKYERASVASRVDSFEPQIRLLLAQTPKMPTAVIMERVGWVGARTVFYDRVRALRPAYSPPDPVDRVEYEPGEVAQCDLWFPPVHIPVGLGQAGVLPVLAMTCGYSRATAAMMIPSRTAGDILGGMWSLIRDWGACPRMLVWDRESAIGGRGVLTQPAAQFAGTLGVKIRLAPAREPEYKGLVERRNGWFETSFLPGRTFISPFDFNDQLGAWLAEKNNTHRIRRIGFDRVIDRWPDERAAMVGLPAISPMTGIVHRARLPRDYYVRIASNDYSIDPRYIGRWVDVTATAESVVATVDGQVVTVHDRYWGNRATITNPEHVQIAKDLRNTFNEQKRRNQARNMNRFHADGHAVALRALPDYDELFGVDFDPLPTSKGA
jgi:transposase